jgi:hypothetical protein
VFGRKDKDSAWRSRFPETATCVRCLQQKDLEDMDRLLWCDSCRESARRRAALWGWGVGAFFAASLALWIKVYIQPSDIVIGGWIATVVVALWIGGRIAREVAYGVMRYQNRKAADAVPPNG